MNIEILFAFSLATAALALSPGPDNIYVLTQSLARGSRYGIATTAGLITGCLVHTALLAFGVSALIKNNPAIYTGIKWFGAAYLFYLAINVIREKNPVQPGGENLPDKSLVSLFQQGFFMNVLNPKVALFFLAFFPGFLFSETLSPIYQFFILGFVFMLISFLIFSAIALSAGLLSAHLKAGTSSYIILKWLQVIVFVGIAVFLLIS